MNIRKMIMNLALMAFSSTMLSPFHDNGAHARPPINITGGCRGDSKAQPVTLTYLTYNIAHGRGSNPLLDYPTDTSRDFRLICSRPNLERRLDSIAHLIKSRNPDIVILNEADFVKDGFWSTWNFKTDLGDYFYGRLNMPYLVKGSKNAGANSMALATLGKMKEIFDNCSEYRTRHDIWLHYSPTDAHKILSFHTGNAMFSKYSIEKTKTPRFRQHMEYSLDSYTDSYIDVKGIQLRVIMTHLDEHEGIYQAMEILEDVKGSKENIIISGDFNSAPSSKTMKMFVANGFRMIDAGYTYAPGKKTLDYIMVRGDIKILSYEVIESGNSDHYPVFATLEISPR